MSLVYAAYLAANVALAQIPLDTPMLPSGPWNVDRGEQTCLLMRQFGQAPDTAILNVRIGVSDDVATVYFAHPAGSDNGGSRGGSFVVSAGDGRSDATGNYQSQFSSAANLRIETFYIDLATLRSFETSERLNLVLDKKTQYVLALPNLSKALATLRTCDEGLMAKWGMDMAARARVAQPAQFIGTPATLFGPDQYPPEALRAGQSGRVIALLNVGSDGSITECRVAVSSKSRPLDDATCVIAKRRLRLSPAEDVAGNAIVSQKWLDVNWQLSRWKIVH